MKELITELLSNSVKLGHGTTNYVFDNRRFLNGSNTKLLLEVADGMWAKIKHLGPEVLFGKGVGASSLLTAIKMRAWMLDKVELSILFIRDERKTKGSFKKLVEGLLPQELLGKKAVFIDDLYNLGATFEKSKQTLFEEGFELDVVGAAVMIDLWVGSRALTAIGFPFYALLRRHDLGLTRIDSGLKKVLTSLRWKLEHHHEGIDYMPIKSKPVISDGLIYIGNDNTHQYCYDVQTGDLVWKYESVLPSLKGNTSVAQLAKGNVYWSAYDGVVRCAKAKTGEHVWAAKLDTHLHSSPCLDIKNDRLFIGTEWAWEHNGFGRGDIVSLKASTGDELWRTTTRGMIPSSPEYSAKESLVVCGSNDFHLYGLDANTGAIRFKIPTKGEVKGKPTFSDGESVVIASTNYGYVYAVALKNSKILWERRIGENSIHGYPIVEGASVFVTNKSGHVQCLDLFTGRVKWLAKVRGEIGWGITSTDSCLIVSTVAGHIVTIDKVTGKKLSSDRLESLSSYQPVAYDKSTRSLVISTNKGILCYDALF